ncbi:MAG: methyltransferase domain-containing protein [Acidimicrobiaceae bacterium]|nr:methyltransferase domain-containing protein [Acidimicrobiaceae bacterium]MCY4280893.1 methyltransferase domain-containing protein [Acidimicrobiaceae bacterium]MCY4294077.1 methyltransferase domain-containing protein [Acidimicrobiaceae bacterium]
MRAATETAAQRWARQMADWAVPQKILDSAARQPFVFSPEIFAAPDPGTFEPSLSNRRAAEALGDGGSVLDVGCGGGSAAFAVTPPATEVTGTDRQEDMLELFASTAVARGLAAQVHAGPWPEAADAVPAADVVVCHNVLYNTAEIVPFVAALDAKARRRVVIEITPKHPQDRRRALWQHFWGLQRPHEPTAATAVEAIAEAGFEPVVEESLLGDDPRAEQRRAFEAAQWCRNLCLPPEREPEVAELMAGQPFTRERVTIWWDTEA